MARLIALALALVFAASGFCQGLIFPNRIGIPPRPGEPVLPPLETKSLKVKTEIVEQVYKTHVDQTFHNPTPHRLEGQYLFLLPRDASVSDFALYIDGKKVNGELLEKEKAKGIYEGIVRRMQDPALLEYMGSNVFQARIFPIEPNSDRRIEMTYQGVCAKDFTLVKYAYPLHTPQQIARPIGEFVITVDVTSKQPLKNVYSPTHTVASSQKQDTHAVVSFEGKNVAPDQDFNLYWASNAQDVGLNLLTYRPDKEEDGYFLALLSPNAQPKKGEVIPKDIVFVVDTSGSMVTDDRITQAKKALKFCVQSLGREDRFNLITFATESNLWNEGLLPADDANVKKAVAWIDKDVRAAGGTNINDALADALKQQPAERKRPFTICFITDGEPTVGVTEPKEIVENLKKAGTSVRIFSLGIGEELNAKLVDEIASTTNAVSEYIKPKEDIELKVSNFYNRISSPVLTNIDLSFGTVRVGEVYPKKLPDLFRGSQLTVVGRYKTSGATALQINGQMGAEPVKLAFDASFPETASEHDFLPRIWATRKVGYLLDEIRLHGENKELKDEVIRLARKFAIVTPYTSYLVVEDTKDQLRPQAPVPPPMDVWMGRDDGGVTSNRAGAPMRSFAEPESRRERDMAPAAAPAMESELMKKAEGTLSADKGKAGIRVAEKLARMKYAIKSDEAEESGVGRAGSGIRTVGARTFLFKGGRWVDTAADDKAGAPTVKVKYGSEAYFKMLGSYPELARCAALGKNVDILYRGKRVAISESEGADALTDDELKTQLGAP